MRDDERRRFPRLLVPVLYRSARLLASRTEARDLSMGGIRVLTDSALTRGQRLEIELFLPSGDSFSVDVSVAWVSPAEADSGAKFEAGLSFFALDARKAALLEECVARGASEAPPA